MDYEIKQEKKRTIAGFHLVGPWEKTVKQGFDQLMMWVENHNIEPLEWVAVYYDNPDEVPAEKLRCDTVVTVPENFCLPENSEGVNVTEIAGGQYAVTVARVQGMISARHGINLLIACWKILSIRWPTNRALRFI